MPMDNLVISQANAWSDIFLSESDMKAFSFRDIIFSHKTAVGNITMQSIISLRSNTTRRQANITVAHFLTKCATIKGV